MTDVGKPALQSKPKKRLMREKKWNICSPPITVHFNLIISWGACLQSALPLKSYRGVENNPMRYSRWALTVIVILYPSPNPPAPKDSPTRDLAAYGLTSSCHFHVNGKPGTSLCVVVGIRYWRSHGYQFYCSSSSSHWLYKAHVSHTAANFCTTKN